MIKIGYRGLLQWEYSVFGIEKYSKRYKKYYKRTIYSGCSGRNRREHEWVQQQDRWSCNLCTIDY